MLSHHGARLYADDERLFYSLYIHSSTNGYYKLDDIISAIRNTLGTGAELARDVPDHG